MVEMPTTIIFINFRGISEDVELHTAWIMRTKDSTTIFQSTTTYK